MVVVGVADDEAVEAAPAASRERGQDDFLAAVEPRARRRSRVEQQPEAARLDDHGEAVADVEHERSRGAVRRQLKRGQRDRHERQPREAPARQAGTADGERDAEDG